ncbi:DNA polymerase theta [Chrysochromulina tobinii]|uniref:DNA polymerase theta n=1 Tax=Chrysochromulina tobinii TaxID=1460289 RepID=A0A0M0LRW5_9EUKA|nr:DNA polymerase theta [Chrysochromulina tobinii]|eukprot:KOO53794.1 DNA polymerase theta [Chrysochromulina sp. CCMP291]
MALSDPSTVVDDRDWWLGIDDLTGPSVAPAEVPPPAAPVAAPVAPMPGQLSVCVSSPPFGSHAPCAAVAPASASAAGISGAPANFTQVLHTASASVAASPLVDASASVEVTAAALARGESRSRAAEADAHLSVRAALGTGGCGLRTSVVAAYEELGVHRLYPWQHACLLGTEGVLDGRNLVYSTPTSGGKSLVADVLLCRALQRRQKGLLVLPYVSMVEEVTERLTRLLRSLPTTGRRAGRPGAAGKLRVEASHGARSRNGFDGDVDLLVCTIERASAVVHRMLEMPEGLRELGIVVVDEVHMLADPSRGHAIENLLTLLRAERHKLAMHAARHPASSAPARALTHGSGSGTKGGGGGPQIVVMSATLGNPEVLASWLGAALYVSEERPVPLTHSIKGEWASTVALACEAVRDGAEVLIFCATKAKTAQCADALARAFEVALPEAALVTPARLAARCTLLERLHAASPTARTLELYTRTVPHGVALHHAGLGLNEKSAIEEAFRKRTLRVLCATTTLAAGVNLPARRVILPSPYDQAGVLLQPISYRQMAGRAGRAGLCELGEVFVVAGPRDRDKAVRRCEHNG